MGSQSKGNGGESRAEEKGKKQQQKQEQNIHLLKSELKCSG